MRNLISTIAFFLCVKTICFSQNDFQAWTKADRENLYEDCLSYITKYKSTTQDQRESISLCYLEKVTEKYGKNDFSSKIEIELKRIKESIITECSKNLGIALNIEVKEEPVVKKEEPKKEEPVKEMICKKENLIGKWKADANYTLEFQKDGRFVLQYLEPTYSEVRYNRIVNDVKTGDFFVDEKGIVTLVYLWNEEILKVFKDNKIQKYTATYAYKVLTFSKDYFKLENITVPESPRQFNRIE
jgi:hypothetical protein